MSQGEIGIQPDGCAARSQGALIPVLYIGGDGRSGSTILSAILGNHEGYLPVGELPDVWQALQTNELCGCGAPFSDCDFWSAVGVAAFGGWHGVDAEDAISDDALYTRHRRIPQLLWWSRHRHSDAGFEAYCERIARLYRAIKEVSGCAVIVDSTKTPPFAMLLRNVPGIDLRVVHLVRDSRGVAFSWNKKEILNPQYAQHPTLKDRPMATISPWKSALTWDLKNVLFHFFTSREQRLFVRYEALASDPTGELNRIFTFAESHSAAAVTVAEPPSTLQLMAFHTLGGNPVRFTRGNIQLRADTRWRTEMRWPQKLLVDVLTFPLLLAYGYVDVPKRLRRGRSDSSSLSSGR